MSLVIEGMLLCVWSAVTCASSGITRQLTPANNPYTFPRSFSIWHHEVYPQLDQEIELQSLIPAYLSSVPENQVNYVVRYIESLAAGAFFERPYTDTITHSSNLLRLVI